MDASRTGVTWTTAVNVDESIGTFADGVYTSPNGRTFSDCATSAVAADMLAAQPDMHELKLPVGYAAMDFVRRSPECELGDLLVDLMMRKTQELTGEKVDFGLLNKGGLRTDIPEGQILLDDIESMLPFNNRYCYVQTTGEELIHIMEFIAGKAPQIIGGARVVVADGLLKEFKIGGKDVDPAALYGVATLDFLLDGGDGISVARNAKKLIITDMLPKTALREYVCELTARGDSLKYSTDGRFVVENQEDRK